MEDRKKENQAPAPDEALPRAVEENEIPHPVKDPEKRLGLGMLAKVALASVVICSLVISITCVMRANQLAEEAAEVQAEITDYKEKIARLKYYLDKEVDDDYIIEYAREYLDMYFPDEEIYYNDVNE